MTTKRVFSIIFLIIGIIGGKLVYNALFGPSDLSEYEEKGWIKSKCLGVSFKAPFELSPTDLPIHQSTRKYLKEVKSYKYDSGPIGFSIARAEYQAGVATNINAEVEGAVEYLQSQKKITDLSYEISNIDSSFIEGRVLKGTCKFNKKNVEFIIYVYSKTSKSLQIILWNFAFPEHREIRDRILKSIKIAL